MLLNVTDIAARLLQSLSQVSWISENDAVTRYHAIRLCTDHPQELASVQKICIRKENSEYGYEVKCIEFSAEWWDSSGYKS